MAAISNQTRAERVTVQLVLLILAVVWLVPVAWMVVTSVKTTAEIFTLPLRWLPSAPTILNYETVIMRSNLLLWFMNSLIITGSQVVLTIVVSALAAYAFARIRFPGRQILFILVLTTLMIPGQVTLIPTYLIISRLGWVNTYQAAFVPEIGAAFGIFLLRQFFLGIPEELEDSARIDGSGRFRMFLQIVLPMSIPAIAALGIFTTINAWNNFLWPLIVLHDSTMMTLPVGLAMLQGTYATSSYGVLMAAATIASAPVLVVYMFFQRKIIQGVSISGVLK